VLRFLLFWFRLTGIPEIIRERPGHRYSNHTGPDTLGRGC
jgi:hypothetical protein